MVKVLFRGDNPMNFLKLTEDQFFTTLAHADEKNKAQFYFYSDSKEYASQYGSYVSEWNLPTGAKILDLTKESDRQIIAPYFKDKLLGMPLHCISWAQQEIANGGAYERGKYRKMTKTMAKEREKTIAKWQQVVDDINNGVFSDTKCLASQHLSDDESGIYFKEVLIQLGYDGFCFSESKYGLTYGLINKAWLDIDAFKATSQNAKKVCPQFDAAKALANDMAQTPDGKKIAYIIENANKINLVDADENAAVWYVACNIGRFSISIPSEGEAVILPSSFYWNGMQAN